MAGGMEFALGPKENLFVASLTTKVHTLGNQAAADTQPSRTWLNQEQPKLRRRLRFLDKKNCADALAMFLRDPTALVLRIEILDEPRDNLRNQSFEAFIVTVFLPVKLAMALHDPSHISGLVLAKDVSSVCGTRAPLLIRGAALKG